MEGSSAAGGRRYSAYRSESDEFAASGNNEKDARASHPRASSHPHTSESEPPYTRLFVLCGKERTEGELRSLFEEYGTIQDLFIVKDRTTGESKGMSYVTYKLTSSAALAQEGLHDKVVGSDTKPIRVVIASDKRKPVGFDVNDDNSRNRLFVVMPKGSADKDLEEKFRECKDFESCYVVRDRQTSETKGYGYIKFALASSAALAMEGCTDGFRAVIAEPKEARGSRAGASSDRERGRSSSYDVGSLVHPPLPPTGRSTARYPGSSGGGDHYSNPSRLYIVVSTSVSQDQLAGVCGVAPGMETCDLKLAHGTRESRGFAFVTYSSPEHARYAKETLSCVEYPPGSRLVVKYAEDYRNKGRGNGEEQTSSRAPYDDGYTSSHAEPPRESHSYRQEESAPYNYDSPYGGSARPRQPAEDASHYYDQNESQYSQYAEPSRQQPPRQQPPRQQPPRQQPPPARSDVHYAQSAAPPPRAEEPYHPPAPPAASAHAGAGTRLFFVGQPEAPPEGVLRSVFSHFGRLIDAYVVRGHNYGYARYEDAETAQMAIRHLHSSEVVGNKLKVVLADPPRDSDEPRPKRSRM